MREKGRWCTEITEGKKEKKRGGSGRPCGDMAEEVTATPSGRGNQKNGRGMPGLLLAWRWKRRKGGTKGSCRSITLMKISRRRSFQVMT